MSIFSAIFPSAPQPLPYFLHGIPEKSTENHINQNISLSKKINKQSKVFAQPLFLGRSVRLSLHMRPTVLAKI